jgi:hypothetical protein
LPVWANDTPVINSAQDVNSSNFFIYTI